MPNGFNDPLADPERFIEEQLRRFFPRPGPDIGPGPPRLPDIPTGFCFIGGVLQPCPTPPTPGASGSGAPGRLTNIFLREPQRGGLPPPGTLAECELLTDPIERLLCRIGIGAIEGAPRRRPSPRRRRIPRRRRRTEPAPGRTRPRRPRPKPPAPQDDPLRRVPGIPGPRTRERPPRSRPPLRFPRRTSPDSPSTPTQPGTPPSGPELPPSGPPIRPRVPTRRTLPERPPDVDPRPDSGLPEPVVAPPGPTPRQPTPEAPQAPAQEAPAPPVVAPSATPGISAAAATLGVPFLFLFFNRDRAAQQGLTLAQEPQVGFQPERAAQQNQARDARRCRNECERRARRRRRTGKCRDGFFRERRDRTEFITWREEDCLPRRRRRPSARQRRPAARRRVDRRGLRVIRGSGRTTPRRGNPLRLVELRRRLEPLGLRFPNF